MEFEYTITLDDFAEACDAFDTARRQHGKAQRSSHALLWFAAIFATSVATFGLWLAIPELLETPPEVIAENFDQPAPWLLLICIASSYRFISGQAKILRYLWVIVGGLICFALAAFILQYVETGLTHWLAWSWVGAIYCITSRNLIFRTGYANYWRLQPHLAASQKLVMDEYGFMVTGEGHSFQWSWQISHGWSETANHFMLYTTALSFQIVPKRVVVAGTTLDSFRDYLSEWTGQPRRGFPVILKSSKLSE